MSNALMMAIVASLRPKAQGIVPVGEPYTLNWYLGDTPITLPAQAVAGDVLVVHVFTNDATTTWTLPPDALPLIAVGATKTGRARGAWGYVLQAADIAAGSVPFTTSGGGNQTVIAQVWRGVSAAILDAPATVSSATAEQASPVTLTAPGLTTASNGAVVLFQGAVACLTTPQDAPTLTEATPAGFTDVAATTGFPVGMKVAYMRQAAPGVISDVVTTASYATSETVDWSAGLIVLRPKAPAITLSATFPSNPHVGDTISFDVIAALVDGATGTPTITVDQLPAGLTLGSTSQVDATHYKATVSGTPTTVQDITSTFGTTGGSVAATPLTHEFNVVEAGATVDLVDCGHSANSGTTVNMSVPVTVSAGDTILAVLSARQGATNTGPAGFALVDDYIAVSSTSMSEILVYTKTADGTETAVAASSARSSNGAALQVWKVPGGATVETFRGGRGAAGSTTSWSVGPFTPPNDNSVVIALWSSGLPMTESAYAVDAAWGGFTLVDTNTSTNIGTASIGWATQTQTTKTAATATFSASGGINNPTDYMIAVSK